MQTAVGKVFDYLIGLAVFGLFYWILNGIIPEFSTISVHDSIYTLANYLWAGSVVIYLVFGALWFLNALKIWDIERRYYR